MTAVFVFQKKSLIPTDPAPERYWELLAEERRLALQEALEENERVRYCCNANFSILLVKKILCFIIHLLE